MIRFLLALLWAFAALPACGDDAKRAGGASDPEVGDDDEASPDSGAHESTGGVEAGSAGGVEAGSVGGVEGGSAGGVEAGVESGVEAGSAGGVEAGVESGVAGGTERYGKSYEGGQFHLGPVDWGESMFHNACAPQGGYRADVQKAEGKLLAGLWSGIPNVGSYCDACIQVTTARGKMALLRVVTYGDTTTNSIDVSAEAMKLLDSGEFPRAMSWSFAKCPDTGALMYEFQAGSSEWWTSLWVRNGRAPIAKVEVKSKNHASYVTLSRDADGTLTDDSGFGAGEFTIKLTATDGAVHVDTFAWPAAGLAGKLLTGQGNFE